MNRAADWLKQAERDLQVAETDAAAGYHEWAAFAAQQGAKKAVKALVQSLHGAVRGYSVSEILRQLSAGAHTEVPESILKAAIELDKVYVTSRYPNGFTSGSPSDYFTEECSQELISYGQRILEFCRSKIH